MSKIIAILILLFTCSFPSQGQSEALYPHSVTIAQVVHETHPMRLGSFRHYIRCAKKQTFALSLPNKNDFINIAYQQNSFRINADEEIFDIHKTPINRSDTAHYRLTFELPTQPDEIWWGGGEQFSHFVLNGHTVTNWAEEQGIGRGDLPISALTALRGASGSHNTSFAPLAQFRSSKGRNFYFDLSGYTTIHFAKNKIRITAIISSAGLHINAVQTRAATYIATRRSPFMLGTVVGLQGGTDSVLQKLAILERAGVQPSAIWLQDWCGRRVTPFGKQLKWNWELDTLRYPRFAAFRQILAQKNIKLLGYINPFLAADLPLAQAALAQKLVLTHGDGSPYRLRATGFDVYLLDVAQFDAQVWLKNIVATQLVKNGFTGYMADFGEWCPADAYSAGYANRQHLRADHSAYTRTWSYLNHRIVTDLGNDLGGDSLTFFMRSAAEDSPEYTPFYWAGDQNTTWQRHDGLPSVIPAMLSSGISGMLINGSDVGGFTSFKKGFLRMTRSRELLYRWIELGAFSPIFRTHEGLSPDYNMQVYSDTACASFYAKFSKIRAQIQPDILTAYEETFTKSLPMARPLWLHYPDDKNTYRLQQEYLLGENILVIPVLRKGATTVKAYFPKGDWQHLLRPETIHSNGEWRTIAAPVGTPAVFRRGI
jgi:sulfoquinovosidase